MMNQTQTLTPSMDAGVKSDPCGCPEFTMSRRRLLATAAASAGALAGATMIGDSFRQVAYGATKGGNVVVVLSMRGGSDGLSIVVPKGADHATLTQKRPDLVVPLDRLVGGDANFGLHPALAPLVPMWTAGTFGAVHGVGLPMSNRSHFDAQNQMEDADPGSVQRRGWINRMIGASALAEEHMQLGNSMIPLQLAGPAPSLAVDSVNQLVLPSHWADKNVGKAVSTAWKGKGSINKSVKQAVSTTARLKKLAATNIDTASQPYPEGSLRRVLANTAALIKADVGARVITIDYGDWDMHEGQGRPEAGDGNWMYNHLDHLANSLVAFFNDLGTHSSRVTLMTMSEFGRRVEQNGSGAQAGTDHGYGNAMLMFGAGVNGGKVNGKWTHLDKLNDGDVSLATDYRSVVWNVMKKRFPEIKQSTVFPGFKPEAVGAMK